MNLHLGDYLGSFGAPSRLDRVIMYKEKNRPGKEKVGKNRKIPEMIATRKLDSTPPLGVTKALSATFGVYGGISAPRIYSQTELKKIVQTTVLRPNRIIWAVQPSQNALKLR